jgi:hypothetical protein
MAHCIRPISWTSHCIKADLLEYNGPVAIERLHMAMHMILVAAAAVLSSRSSLLLDKHGWRLKRIFNILDRDADGVVSAAEALTGLGIGLEGQSVLQLCSQASLHLGRDTSCGIPYTTKGSYVDEIDAVDFSECMKSWGAGALVASGACSMLPQYHQMLNATPPLLTFDASFAIFVSGTNITSISKNRGNNRPTPPQMPRQMATGGANATILLSSDWHIEPWFSGDAYKKRQSWWHGGVSRFAHPSNLNIMRCADGATGLTELPCAYVARTDPPLSHAVSHFDAFEKVLQNRTPASPPSLFFIGDTQAHTMNYTEFGNKARQCPPCEWNFTAPYDMAFAIKTLLSRVMAVVKKTFAPDDVYWVAGNHDGPEDSTFAHLGTMRESLAWANVLVEEGIVTNKLGRRYAPNASSLDSNDDRAFRDSSNRTPSLAADSSLGSLAPLEQSESLNQTAFFLETGYYLKPFAALSGDINNGSTSSQRLFVMCTNTCLGKSNPRQMRAMENDLQWINTTTNGGLLGGVFVLGHYPQISGCFIRPPTYECGIDTFIPPRFHHLIRGTFAGHVHFHTATNRTNLFTQVGSLDPAGSNSFMVTEISASTGYRVVVDPTRDAYTFSFKGKPGEVSSAQWWKAPNPRPGAPTPPPTPAPAPVPTPVPPPTPLVHGWECHENRDNHYALTAPPYNLKDHDYTEGLSNLADCEGACNASLGCVVVVWHGSDRHCHTLTGHVTRAQFIATLNVTAKSVACMHITTVPGPALSIPRV